MPDDLPTWMTVADGRGLEPPEDYIGPVRAGEFVRGFWWRGKGYTARRWAGNPRKQDGDYCTFEHLGADWLLDLDRPEGADAAVRKLAQRLGWPPGEGYWHRYEGAWQLSWLATMQDAEDHPQIGKDRWHYWIPPRGLRDTDDPRVALAMALAEQEDTDV